MRRIRDTTAAAGIGRRHLLATSVAMLAAPGIVRAQGKRVLTFIPQSDLSVLDPIWAAAYVVRNHAMMVFDTLYGMDASYRIHPQMAVGHRVEDDGRTWSIALRDGLVWHDGQKVLARDCVASIRRWGARDGFGQTLLAVTDELSAPDDRTIRFRLKHPFPLLPAALGKPSSNICIMMPERLANTDPFKQVTDMTGSGPFRFIAKDHVVGSLVAYERNAAYVPRPDGTPSFTAGPKIAHIDRVEWHVQPDASTAAAAMQAGEHDWWENPSFDLLPLLRGAKNLNVVLLNPTGTISGLRFNHLQPPFSNPVLRRALLGAVNQEDFMTAVATSDRRNWVTGVGVFCPGTPMASDAGMEVLTGPRNLDRVRRAVAESGYKGERAVVPIPTDLLTLKAMGEVGVDKLQRAGINVEPRYTDRGSVIQLLAKMEPVEQDGWSALHTGWSGFDQFDPAVHLWIRGNGRQATRGWPESPQLEALRDAWFRADDITDQRRIAVDIQRQVFVDVPYIPLGQYLPLTVFQRTVIDALSGYPLFWNLRKAE
jgi:peptide/nickel transport system substrate-binding protein